MEKPRDVFDRDSEWRSLAAFATNSRSRFGVVYGRRRQGKSWLLERIAERAGGWYWEAVQGTKRQQLDALGVAFAGWTRAAATPRFEAWSSALDALLRARPQILVLDEFQHLVDGAPELPSELQARVSRAYAPPTIVCGSALGAMRRLLGTSAPLRGRASLELIVRPFDFRTAARYWRVGGDLETAVRLHAFLGGTPAYRDFVAGRAPAKSATFDEWVCDVLLDPAGALFREGRILADEPVLVDRALYHGILAAVASGRTRRGQIAATLGRPDNTLAHPLNALVDLALLERKDDPLHERRSTFHLADPLLRTYQTLISPNEGLIERRGARRVWSALRETVSARIYGPHFEHLAREWMATHASQETLGGLPSTVGSSVIGDPEGRRELEIDAVAVRGRQVLALGEAKWTATPVGNDVLARLERKRALLGARAKTAKLVLFARTSFDSALRARARRRRDVELVDLRRLYRGE